MKYREFYVNINFPEKLKPLESLAYNLWWTYNNAAKDLFKMINPDLWRMSANNPIAVLSSLSHEKMEKLEKDPVFLSRLESVWNHYIEYLSTPKWFEMNSSEASKNQNMLICYMSMEYGLHESMQTYAGGLGILSGDHCKSASDIGLPFVAVGILYRNGYFHQYLNSDGWQLESYPYNEFSMMPINSALNENGENIYIYIDTFNETIKVKIWLLNIGYVKFILLDTDIPENSEEARKISGKLYDGDPDMRIKQEILLGIGGIRALEKLNISPSVYHINEGHPAFSVFERVKNLMEQNGLTFEEAFTFVHKTTLFTTHTPVPAGFDVFDTSDINKFIGPIYSKTPLKIDDILKLGKVTESNIHEGFSLAICSAKASTYRNGVSKLHGQVSKDIFTPLWPSIPKNFIPIDHVTNGVHLPTWVADEFKTLYNRYLGEEWYLKPQNFAIWDNVDDIPDLELYEAKQILRTRMVEFIRKRLKESIKKRDSAYNELLIASEKLRSDVLTIGFARRFATYKRGFLLFSDTKRLFNILSNSKMPVQVVIAGKAHPKDNEGKEIIKQINHIAKKAEFRDKIVFVEDYDIQLAKFLVRGVDIWLNNPLRPMEASGTSGMKAAINGGLNFSILDGWWVEGYNGENGWSIGAGEEYENSKYQDYIESEEMYDKLENEIVPMFYNRDKNNVPREWIRVMKNSIKSVCSYFNTTRMLIEYTEKYYNDLNYMNYQLSNNNYQELKDYVSWIQHIKNTWNSINVYDAYLDYKNLKIGDTAKLIVKVNLNGLSQNEVSVIAMLGRSCSFEEDPNKIVELDFIGKSDLISLFEKDIILSCPGRFSVTFGIFPKHKFIKNRFENNLFIWC